MSRGVLLVAHGSRDERATVVVQRIAAAVEAGAGVPAAVGHVELAAPSVAEAVEQLAARGVGSLTVVPLLLAPGFHVRVDVPSLVGEAVEGRGWPVEIGGALVDLDADPDGADLLLDVIDDRLGGPPGLAGADALVLAASGSSKPGSLAVTDALAARWGARHGKPARPAYSSGAGPRVGDVVEELVEQGRRVVVGSLFVAPGRLPDVARREAVAAGAAAVGGVMADHPALVRHVVHRACSPQPGSHAPARLPAPPSGEEAG